MWGRWPLLLGLGQHYSGHSWLPADAMMHKHPWVEELLVLLVLLLLVLVGHVLRVLPPPPP